MSPLIASRVMLGVWLFAALLAAALGDEGMRVAVLEHRVRTRSLGLETWVLVMGQMG